MANIAPYTPPQPPTAVAPAFRPCDPLTPEQVWKVASEVFAKNGEMSAYSRAERAYDAKHGCFAIAVEGIRPVDFDIIATQIGEKLETDFTVLSKDGKFLMTINEIPNTTSDEADARSASDAEWQRMREKCRMRFI